MLENFGKIKRKLAYFIDEIILVGIILLNVLDFAQVLSPDLDYAKKILSWTALGYLLYRASLTEIFFGTKKKLVDGLLIISFFLMTFKNLIGFAAGTLNEIKLKGFSYWGALFSADKITPDAKVVDVTYPDNSVNLTNIDQVTIKPEMFNAIEGLADKVTINPEFPMGPNQVFINLSNSISHHVLEVQTQYSVHRWLNFIMENQATILNSTLVAGMIMLVAIAIYATLKIRIKKPSIMHIIHEEGLPPRGLKNISKRFLTIFFLLIIFFVAIFNFAMEWLAVTIDAPIIVIGLLFYAMVWIKHHNKFDTHTIIYRMGNFGEIFYEKFMKVLKTRRGILLGFSGMLVLHLLVDLGAFFIPYTFGIYNSLYFEELGPNHQPVFNPGDLFSEEKNSLYGNDMIYSDGIIQSLSITYNYVGNHLALLMLLFIPAMIWYKIFKRRKIYMSKTFMAVFLASFTCFILNPVYSITRIGDERLIGVDIQTQGLIQNASFAPLTVALISIFIGLIIYLISGRKELKKRINFAIIMIAVFYFAYYIFNYFIDISFYFINLINNRFIEGSYVLAFIFLLLFSINIFFYLGAFIAYIYEIITS